MFSTYFCMNNSFIQFCINLCFSILIWLPWVTYVHIKLLISMISMISLCRWEIKLCRTSQVTESCKSMCTMWNFFLMKICIWPPSNNSTLYQILYMYLLELQCKKVWQPKNKHCSGSITLWTLTSFLIPLTIYMYALVSTTYMCSHIAMYPLDGF